MPSSDYVPQPWHDLPVRDTPIDAAALERIEDGLRDHAHASYAPLPAGTPTEGQVPVVTDASPLALGWGAGGGGVLLGQAGIGDPNTVVTPTAKGYLYQDTDSGALYVALGTSNTSWVLLGGLRPARLAMAADTDNLIDYYAANPPGPGPAGNGVTIRVTDNGVSQPLTINVTGSTIEVDVATDAGGLPITTCDELFSAIHGDFDASNLVNPFQHDGFDGSAVVVENSVVTSGGEDEFYFYGLGGGYVIKGDGQSTALDVSAIDGGVGDLARIVCSGYGITVNNHGTLIGTNDDDNPCVQWYANDGSDLAFELGGGGQFKLPLLPTSDPHVAGQWYVAAGAVKVSAG